MPDFDMESAYSLALAASREGNLEVAERLFGEIIAHAPEDPVARRMYGFVMLASEKFPEAARALRDCLSLDPGDPAAWRGLGMALEEQRELAASEDAFRKSVALRGTQSTLWLLAQVVARQRRWKEAIAIGREALSLDPSNVDVLVGLGLWLSYEDDNEGARRLFEKALAIDPSRCDARRELGYVFYGLGESEDAVDTLMTAIECDPSDSRAHLWLAISLKSLGRYDEARRELAIGVSLCSTDAKRDEYEKDYRDSPSPDDENPGHEVAEQ